MIDHCPPRGFEILYEDGPLLAVAKPGGVLTQAAPGVDSMEVRIKRFLKRRDRRQGKIYLGVVHRLDRPVSGVMLFGLNTRTTRKLARQFEQRLVEKIYFAMVEGDVEGEHGTWQDFLRKIPGEPKSEVVAATADDAKEAILKYRVHRRERGHTLLRIKLETGRTHQIRVQAAARGHAVLGDELYGSSVAFGPHSDNPRQRLIALHARSLVFRHPTAGKNVHLTAAFPDAWPDASATTGKMGIGDT